MGRDDWDDGIVFEDEERPRARPFVVTKGKTTTKSDVRVETLVELVDPESTDRFERGDVLDMAREKSISVAELSAHLKLPMGTMVTLVGQMVDDGQLSAHAMVNSSAGASATDNIDIMTRIINRVREL